MRRLSTIALALAACVDGPAPAGPPGAPGLQGPQGAPGEPGPRGAPGAELIYDQTAAAQPASFDIAGTATVRGGLYVGGGGGDANEDGVVSSADSGPIVDYYTAGLDLSDEAWLQADVDGDGLVTPLDEALVRELVLGVDPASVLVEGRRRVARHRDGLVGGNGDVVLSGAVDAADAMYLQDYFLGTRSLTAVQRLNADVNADGAVNRLDLDLVNAIIDGAALTFADARRISDVAFGATLKGYAHIGKQVSAAPAVGACTTSARGAMAFDPATDVLYICVNAGWRRASLSP